MPGSCSSLGTRTPSAESQRRSWIREETEWERCSSDRTVARHVKTQNLVERSRLTAFRTRLDRELDRELRRLAHDQRDLFEIQENLKHYRSEHGQRKIPNLFAPGCSDRPQSLNRTHLTSDWAEQYPFRNSKSLPDLDKKVRMQETEQFKPVLYNELHSLKTLLNPLNSNAISQE